MEQQIRFASTADGVRIAYAVIGEGPPVVKAANWLTHLEYDWESPVWHHLLTALARRCTLIRYDERGTGLSDRAVQEISFEAWVDDLAAVVDALDLDRFALLGISQGGAVAVAYAVGHPERVTHLVLYGAYARGRLHRKDADRDLHQALRLLVRAGWGTDDPSFRQMFTSRYLPEGTVEQIRWFNDLQRVSATPDVAERVLEVTGSIDVRELLPRIQAPTLALHCRGDRIVPFEVGREMAASIPGARFVPMEGNNHVLLETDPGRETFLREVARFVGGGAEPAALDSPATLVTILFTDIAGSTSIGQRLGDEAAQDVLRVHNAIVRAAVRRHGGSEIKHTGDGIMAAFPAASRALGAAIAIQRDLDAHNRGTEVPLGVRIGLNAGEPVQEAGDLFGTPVQLASRVTAAAAPGEILITEVVRALAAGKGFRLVDRGVVDLKGFDEPSHLYAAVWQDEASV